MAANDTNSKMVWRSNSRSCCGAMPIRRVMAGLARGSSPKIRTVPCDGLASPHRIRNKVDLPAPLGPSRAVTPGPTSKLTSERATTEPNHFASWRTSRVGAPPSTVTG